MRLEFFIYKAFNPVKYCKPSKFVTPLPLKSSTSRTLLNCSGVTSSLVIPIFFFTAFFNALSGNIVLRSSLRSFFEPLSISATCNRSYCCCLLFISAAYPCVTDALKIPIVHTVDVIFFMCLFFFLPILLLPLRELNCHIYKHMNCIEHFVLNFIVFLH
ncbi:hypothetical protein BAMO111457_13115 [Bacillus mobilis]